MAADAAGHNDVVAHWNGSTWRRNAAFTAALPVQSATLTWQVTAINAVRAGDVWVAVDVSRESSTGTWKATPYVLHLSGTTWYYVGKSSAGYYLPGAVSDGNGGWWSPGTGYEFGSGTVPAKPYLLHFTAGSWHKLSLPVPKGYTMAITDVVHVPGSNAMLAVGQLYNGKPGPRSAVLAYGRLPK